MDLQIAAIALANRLPSYTRNPKDLRTIAHLVEIVPI